MADKKKRLTPEERAQLSAKAQELHKQGLTATEIGEKLGVSHVSVGMFLSYAKGKGGKGPRPTPSALKRGPGRPAKSSETSSAHVVQTAAAPSAGVAVSSDAERELMLAELAYLRAKVRVLEGKR